MKEFTIGGKANTFNGVRKVQLKIVAETREKATRTFWNIYPKSEYAQLLESREVAA